MITFRIKFLACALIFLLSSIYGVADEGSTVIQLKNGTTIVGKLKSVNSDKAVIEISGVIAEVPFSEIAEIRGDEQEETRDEKMNTDYCVLDEQDYPETLTLTIGGDKYRMRLIRGCYYYMGYEGRHSIRMRSEPIHRVNLSSFYVSEKVLAVKSLKGLAKIFPAPGNLSVRYWNDNLLDKVLSAVVKEVGMPVRLITDAEWELVARKYPEIMTPEVPNLCADYLGSLRPEEQTDPLNSTSKEEGHIIRMFSTREDVLFDRNYHTVMSNGFLRLVLPASYVKEQLRK